ncbi:hypothetical protein SCOCK_140031 [Actinacidiphila cocklensis]|uniref:Uncharacterized protein n=1 Tax=Actinacidiphila cocklensis TaxID=887465 RepID=A0A9W4DLH6_9ACTN|nr:hypothetical protein SCOCK_140031 [Actinacidiphila cocklensis]
MGHPACRPASTHRPRPTPDTGRDGHRRPAPPAHRHSHCPPPQSPAPPTPATAPPSTPDRAASTPTRPHQPAAPPPHAPTPPAHTPEKHSLSRRHDRPHKTPPAGPPAPATPPTHQQRPAAAALLENNATTPPPPHPHPANGTTMHTTPRKRYRTSPRDPKGSPRALHPPPHPPAPTSTSITTTTTHDEARTTKHTHPNNTDRKTLEYDHNRPVWVTTPSTPDRPQHPRRKPLDNAPTKTTP